MLGLLFAGGGGLQKFEGQVHINDEYIRTHGGTTFALRLAGGGGLSERSIFMSITEVQLQ